jgi:hypothetical protein
MKAQSNKETSLFMLDLLRERISQFKENMTPKIPYLEIMHTERQINVMLQYAHKDRCSREELGITVGELEALKAKAAILRGKLLLRKFRREGLGCEELQQLRALIRSDEKNRLRLRDGEALAITSAQLERCAA